MMNRIVVACIVFWLFTSGCVSSYFATPNDVFLRHATIYFDNGAQKTGEITVQLENGVKSNQYVTLYYKDQHQSEQISVDSIKYYQINNEVYVPKKIDFDFDGTYHFLFVKRLTEENSKIHLYELHQDYKANSTGEDKRLYFISFPLFSKYEVWATYSKNLFPDFADKMSRQLSDCPSLAEKVRSRTKGYFIASQLIPESTKLGVYKRIIDEYNSCQTSRLSATTSMRAEHTHDLQR